MSKKYVTKFVIDNENIFVKDSDLTERVDLLQTRDPSGTKRGIIISDSYGLGRNSTIPFFNFIDDMLEDYADLYMYGNGSTGIAHQGDSSYRAQGVLQAHENEITSKSTITDIIIAMGANDILDTESDIMSNGASLIEYCHTTYPNAVVWFAFIGNILDKNSNTVEAYLKAVRAYRQLGRMKAYTKYMDGCEYVMHDASLMQSDGVHPTTDGCNEIAKAITSCLRYGSYSYVKRQYIGGITGQNGFNLRCTIDGAVSQISFVPASVQTGTTFTDRNYKEICTFDDAILNIPAGAPIYDYIHSFNSDLEPQLYGAMFANKKLYLSCFASSGSLSSGVGGYGFTQSIPTLLT